MDLKTTPSTSQLIALSTKRKHGELWVALLQDQDNICNIKKEISSLKNPTIQQQLLKCGSRHMVSTINEVLFIYLHKLKGVPFYQCRLI